MSFLNITASLRAHGFDLGALTLKQESAPAGAILRDRLFFTKESSNTLRSHLEEQIVAQAAGGDGFERDKPEEKHHAGMADWGGREATTTASMQIGGGKEGAFVDIDEFGVSTDAIGALGHTWEVLRNDVLKKLKLHRGKGTDPFGIARTLHKRGLL